MPSPTSGPGRGHAAAAAHRAAGSGALSWPAHTAPPDGGATLQHLSLCPHPGCRLPEFPSYHTVKGGRRMAASRGGVTPRATLDPVCHGDSEGRRPLPAYQLSTTKGGDAYGATRERALRRRQA
jgi:hypothetical protein